MTNASANKNIQPHTITKPIQLLAAWLFGLIAITGSFLSAAAVIKGPVWLTAILVGAAILFVPLFLFAMFVLQTKFRPEMQEDNYYSEYLREKYGKNSKLRIKDYVSGVQDEIVESIESLKSHGTLSFSSEDDFYDKVNFFIRRAEKKIEAIDFIPPSLWRTDFVLRRYIEIQSKEVEQLKKRIHIYNNEALGGFKREYDSYMKLMREAGFELGFLDQEKAGMLGNGINLTPKPLIFRLHAPKALCSGDRIGRAVLAPRLLRGVES